MCSAIFLRSPRSGTRSSAPGGFAAATGDDPLTLARLSAVVVDPESVRQVFNDTDADQLWLILGAPPEPANSLEMDDETFAYVYPDGARALPPELALGQS